MSRSHAEAANKNQRVYPSETVGKQLDFYVLRTSLPLGSETPESQARFDAIVQLISHRATPCILTLEPPFEENDPVDLDAKGLVAVYVMRFALDSVGVWENTTPTMAQMIAQIGHGLTETNFSVTYQPTM